MNAAQHGWRLDRLVGEWLPQALGQPLSKAAVRRLIVAGAVTVEGRATRRPAFELRAGARVEARVDLARLARAATGGDVAAFTLDPARVLYEDDWLIAVDKPAGLPAHATADPRRPHLVGVVAAYLAARRPGDGAPYLGVHQRLDRDTSGVVLFAKDPAANAGLAAQFAGRVVEKVYVALVVRPPHPPPREWSVGGRLGRVGTGRGAHTASVTEGGVPARTGFRVREVLAGALVVEARPRTGRQHQIRAHLAEAGLPILGDDVYGPRRGAVAAVAPRLMLHAARLALRHPVSGAALTIESPTPPDFADTLATLRRA